MNFLEKIIDKLSLNFLNRKDSANHKNVVKNSTTRDVVGRDLNKVQINNYKITNASKLENKILKVLYTEYVNNGTNGKKIPHTYEILEISDESDVSTIYDSGLIKIDGNFFRMTTDGIRYMDNLEPSDLHKIILPDEQRKRDLVIDQQKRIIEERRRNKWKNSAR